MAWLNAIPRPAAEPGNQNANAPKPVSRLEEAKAHDREIDMPPNPVPAIVEWLMDVGPIDTSGMNRTPISWSEINAWQRGAGVVLAPWQARLLRRLSREYLEELGLAEDPQRPAPWSAAPKPDELAIQEQMLRIMLGFH